MPEQRTDKRRMIVAIVVGLLVLLVGIMLLTGLLSG